MLKNVVLPAPLGPMIETIPRRGTAKETSSTATRPPKIFETASAWRMSSWAPSPLLTAHLERALLRLERRRVRELELPSSLGQEALGAQDHHQHDEEAEDPEVHLGEVEVEAELGGQVVEDLRDEVRVDVGEATAPITTPQIDPR